MLSFLQFQQGCQAARKWLESAFCKQHGITSESVADIVKRALLLARDVPPIS